MRKLVIGMEGLQVCRELHLVLDDMCIGSKDGTAVIVVNQMVVFKPFREYDTFPKGPQTKVLPNLVASQSMLVWPHSQHRCSV